MSSQRSGALDGRYAVSDNYPFRHRVGSSGEILAEKHNPTLIPRYVGEAPPEIKQLDTPGSGGGYQQEEVKNIEEDDVKVAAAASAKVEVKEEGELSQSDSMKAEVEASSTGS